MHISSIIQGSDYRIELMRLGDHDAILKSILVKEQIDLTPIDGWHPKRQLEWVTGRYLIHQNVKSPISELLTSSSGKPYFKNSKEHFSISHSSELIGIGVSELEIGIDIQITSDVVPRTAHKFISPEDILVLPMTWNLATQQHYIWTIKEAVFKSYGLGNVDFIKCIRLQSYTELNSLRVLVYLDLEESTNHYHVDIWKLQNYYLAVALPIN